MEADVRRLLTFPCGEDLLAGSLDGAAGPVGILLVTGGTQTRIGSHRMYEHLAKSLAKQGFLCLRFDRRGVGDSSGDDPDFRGSGDDLKAAADTLRQETKVERIIGFGLCDGATTLALHGANAGIHGAILVNPWLVEAEAGDMAPAAVRSHYRQRLFSLSAWKKLLSGGVNLGKLAGSLKKAGTATDGGLADEAARGLRGMPAALILATGDNTAIAAVAEVKKSAFDGLIGWRREIHSDSHTFARPGDQESLNQAVLGALKALTA